MWNPFKKNQNNDAGEPKMGFMQRMAMKKLQNMSPEEREKMMQEAMKPENQEKLLKAMEKMANSGQISKKQVELAKKRLGL